MIFYIFGIKKQRNFEEVRRNCRGNRQKFATRKIYFWTVRVSAVRRLSDIGRWKFSLFSFPPINTRLFGLRMVVLGMHIHLPFHSRRMYLRLGIYFHGAKTHRVLHFSFTILVFDITLFLFVRYARKPLICFKGFTAVLKFFDRDTKMIPRLDYGYLLNKLTFSSFSSNYMMNK